MAAMMGGWRDCLPDLVIGHELFAAVGPDKVTFRWVIRVSGEQGSSIAVHQGRVGHDVTPLRGLYLPSVGTRITHSASLDPTQRPPHLSHRHTSQLSGHSQHTRQSTARCGGRGCPAACGGRNYADATGGPHCAQDLTCKRRTHTTAAGRRRTPSHTAGAIALSGDVWRVRRPRVRLCCIYRQAYRYRDVHVAI